MESRELKIKKNESKMEILQADYNNLMSRLTHIKDMMLFKVKVSEANGILNKIDTLRKKNEFLRAGLPSNGYADYHEKINIID